MSQEMTFPNRRLFVPYVGVLEKKTSEKARSLVSARQFVSVKAKRYLEETSLAESSSYVSSSCRVVDSMHYFFLSEVFW